MIPHNGLHSDIATRHRISGVFALTLAAAAIAALSGVFVLSPTQLQPTVQVPLLPDARWPAQWLPGTMSAAAQQNAAAEQWLHAILVFGVITALVAALNALIGLLSHANDRRYESAVRGMLGAAPSTLRRYYTTNAITNAFIGVSVGAPLGVGLGLLLLRMWSGAHVAAQPAGWIIVVLLACSGIALVSAFLTGLRFRRLGWLGDALMPESRTLPGPGAEDLRALLTTAQLAGAIAITALGALVWSYTTPGTTAESSFAGDRYVARVHLPSGYTSAQRARTTAALLQRMQNTNGVRAESIASPGALLGQGRIDKVISHCGRCARALMLTPLFPVETQQHVVGSHFFQVAGVPVLLGREFQQGADDGDAVVINQSFARLAFDDPVPLGKRITVGGIRGKSYHVIGVVADIPTIGLHSLEPEPGSLTAQMYVPHAPAIYFSASTHPPLNFDVIAQAPRPITFAGLSFAPLASMLREARAPAQWFAKTVALFGILLCAIALAGTMISSMLSVESRRAEIGLRRALGARRRDIRWLIARRTATLVTRGTMLGVILSFTLARALEPFVPGLPVFNWSTTVAVSLGFASITFAASLLALRQALRIPPARAE